MTAIERPDVVVLGGGPAGLTAAAALAARGFATLVLERERETGGIPRHAHHQGFGLRDLRRSFSGPRYAARLRTAALSAGAELRTGAMVTSLEPAPAPLAGTAAAPAAAPLAGAAAAPAAAPPALAVTSPAGRTLVAPRALILATGTRERPRSARFVAGARPQGVMTTGTLQQAVYIEGEQVGSRAVVVGAEHVSYSALLTLAHGGAKTVAMVTDQPGTDSYLPFALGARVRFGSPLRTLTRVRRILGEGRVEAVELEHVRSGKLETVACDTVVFTGDWIPDMELAATAGIALDPGTRGPRVDEALRTSHAGVFAAGNVLHGAETADVAALDGRHVAASVAAWLAAPAAAAPWPAAPVPIEVAEPLHWVAPNAVVIPGAQPPRGRFLLRSHARRGRTTLRVSQDGRELWSGAVARLGPARCATLPAAWTAAVDPAGGPIRIAIA